jgi:hypothetical protein
MSSPDVKAGWRELRDAGHRLGRSVNLDVLLRSWVSAFEGVPSRALAAAVSAYIAEYDELLMLAPELRRSAVSAGRPWPVPAYIARKLSAEHCRKPPTERDLLRGRWWGPTGSAGDAESWMDWSELEAMRRVHTDAGCYSAWLPSARVGFLAIRAVSGWRPDWPDPAPLGNVEPAASCGMWCAIEKDPDGKPFWPEQVRLDWGVEVVKLRAREATSDAYLAHHNVRRWLASTGAST